MARIVNPYNLDDDDDAIFLGALTDGRIWIEDDENESYGVAIFETIEMETVRESTKHILKGHTGQINALAISGDFAVSASSDKTLRVWNWQTGELVQILRGHTGSVNEVILSGDFAVSASSDKTLRVWNWQTGELVKIINEFEHDISQIAVTEQFVFTITVSTITIWNWQTGEFIQRYFDGNGRIVADGDLLLIIESSNSLRVKNWKTNQLLHRIHVEGYVDEVFLKDDFAIFVDEFDGIRVWNWKTGEQLGESESRNKITNQVLYTSSELAFESDAILYIYDAKANKCYFHLPDESLKFATDYSHIILSDTTDTIQVAQVTPLLRHLVMGKALPEHSSSSSQAQYNLEHILEECRNYIRNRQEQWVNFSRLSQHLLTTFPNLNLRTLGKPNKNYKNLRSLLADYSSDFELRQDAQKQGLYWICLKPKQASNKQNKNPSNIIQSYTVDMVIQSARDFIHQRKEEWVNFSRVSQHLYDKFYNLDPKQLGSPKKNYKNIRHLIENYASDFEVRQDTEKQGLYWIRCKLEN